MALFRFFDEIKTERNLIDLMLERNGLAVIDQLFEYLLIIHEREILTRQSLNLFENMETKLDGKFLRDV